MKPRTALLAVVGLFLLGVAVGVLVANLFWAHQLARPGGAAEIALGFMSHQVRADLDLTPAQEQVLDLVLEDARLEIVEIRHDVERRLVALRLESAARLRESLEPDQRERFELVVEKNRRQFEWLFATGAGASGGR